jgi:hypothetical protein
VAGTGSADVRKLINDINKMKGDIPRHMNREMREAARPVAETAKRNASWSTRIPGAISVGTSRSQRLPGATIKVSKSVPHARLYEFGANGATFRHQTYGHDPWVVENVRPFIAPAIAQHAESFAKALDKAVSKAAAAAGFR